MAKHLEQLLLELAGIPPLPNGGTKAREEAAKCTMQGPGGGFLSLQAANSFHLMWFLIKSLINTPDLGTALTPAHTGAVAAPGPALVRPPISAHLDSNFSPFLTYPSSFFPADGVAN